MPRVLPPPRRRRRLARAVLVTALAALVPVAGRAQHPDDDPAHRPAAAPLMRINGFADVRFVAADPAASDDGFGLGQFDWFVRSQLSESFGVLAEVVVTPRPANQFRIVIERLLVQYAPSDYLVLDVGRYHTAIGYYNAAYHHGTWFQVAAGRPLLFAFESDGGVMPIHTLGVSATGRIPSGALGLRYLAEIGNGRASQASPASAPQPQLRDNRVKAVNVGLVARPEWAEGLQLGASVYRDRLTPDTLPGLDETIAAVHLLYRTRVLEWLSEAAVVRHARRDGSGATDIRGLYAQLSRQFGMARPYLRYDLVDVPASDAIFAGLGRREAGTAGVRLDVDQFAALKLQYSRMESRRLRAADRFEAQLAFTF